MHFCADVGACVSRRWPHELVEGVLFCHFHDIHLLFRFDCRLLKIDPRFDDCEAIGVCLQIVLSFLS